MFQQTRIPAFAIAFVCALEIDDADT